MIEPNIPCVREAYEKLLIKLKSLTKDKDMAVKIVDKAYLNSYKDFYSIDNKEENNKVATW